MQNIKDFLQGKKTYIGAIALALVAILGWWLGAVNGTIAGGMLAAAFGIAGLGAKGDRLAALTMEALNEARRVQQLRASGQKIDWTQEGATVARIVQEAIAQAKIAVPVNSILATSNSFVAPLCIYCGQPITSNGMICTSPANQTLADSAGNKHHVFTAEGATAK